MFAKQTVWVKLLVDSLEVFIDSESDFQTTLVTEDALDPNKLVQLESHSEHSERRFGFHSSSKLKLLLSNQRAIGN